MAALDETRVPTPDLSGPTEQAKDKVRARAILNSARGGKSHGSEVYNVKIPTTPTVADVNEARGMLGKDILSTERLLKMYKNLKESKASGGMIKKYAYGGRVAKSSAEKS